MHPVTLMLEIVVFLWLLSEIALAMFTRAKGRAVDVRDAGSLAFLWTAIAVGICGGILLRGVRAASIPFPTRWLHGIALLILVGGLAVRWTAIITLGRFFTPSVTVLKNHRLIHAGLYRHVRHPSYTGLLVAFLGVAVSYGNWLSFPAVVVPFLAALLYRIRVEESALLKALGTDYIEYRKTTRCLIPGVF
jgi:protein-S-isoprenylcysteine O-methyltransferase Ste14